MGQMPEAASLEIIIRQAIGVALKSQRSENYIE